MAPPSPSPDPLAMDIEEEGDCIVVSSSPPRNRTTPTTRKRKPTVEITTPRKKVAPTKTPTKKPTTSVPSAKRTPSKPTQVITRSTPTPKTTPRKSTPRTTSKSTPTSKKPAHRSSPPLVEVDPIVSEVDISREKFLTNEALKRQREARNFVYQGDSEAPKLTRSGRVVGKRDTPVEEEYGDVEPSTEENNPFYEPSSLVTANIRPELSTDVGIVPQELISVNTTVMPLPAGARRHVINILSTLTSRYTAINPPPFMEEEKNESLAGLVNLLKGTVERGEGNSALVVGSRGVGKTRTITRALDLLPSTSTTKPIIVKLSGLAQTNDRLAIREMGRQIAEASGQKSVEEEEVEEDEYAPTTLPSHLLALLTTPSPRAIIIVMEEFDLFTEHARQALLYCLLDVVQSIKTGPVESTGRGVAVIGLTSRIDTLLLLEKRVKSRFSHRVFKILSPLSTSTADKPWKEVLERALIPWDHVPGYLNPALRSEGANVTTTGAGGQEDKETRIWRGDWGFAVDMMLNDPAVDKVLERLAGLTTDLRILYRPFIALVSSVLEGKGDFLTLPMILDSVLKEIENSSWGFKHSKIRGLPQPALTILIIAKHLFYAGREEFNFAQVEEEYLRFSRTKLVGSGKVRWSIGVLKMAYNHLLSLSLLTPTSSSTSLSPKFQRVRSTLSPFEVVAYFKGEGAGLLGPELGNWGRMMGGHA